MQVAIKYTSKYKNIVNSFLDEIYPFDCDRLLIDPAHSTDVAR